MEQLTSPEGTGQFFGDPAVQQAIGCVFEEPPVVTFGADMGPASQSAEPPPTQGRWTNVLSEAFHIPDKHFDEWQECRTTIGRFDTILADTRKYGFTLVTILLTANALVTAANPVADHVAGSFVVIALLLVLFVMDRYWWVLLRGAAARAVELEPGLGIQVTQRLSQGAHIVHNTAIASMIYAAFVMIAFLVASVTIVPFGSVIGLAAASLISVAGVVTIWRLHLWFELRLDEIPTGEAPTN